MGELPRHQLPYSPYEDLPYPQRDSIGENASVGSTDVPLEGARVFTYGGTTMHWGGWSFRLKPEDFQLGPTTGEGIDWPFTYDTLERYYCEAEMHLAVIRRLGKPESVSHRRISVPRLPFHP